MNKIFFSAVILTLVLACGDKHDKRLDTDLMNTNTDNGVVDTNAAPKIVFQETDVVDLGDAVEGAQIKYKFTFINKGQKDLILTTVAPACGCTSTDYTKEPVKPGGSGYINIVFDSKGKGPTGGEKSIKVEKSVTVESNSIINNPFILKFKVNLSKAQD